MFLVTAQEGFQNRGPNHLIASFVAAKRVDQIWPNYHLNSRIVGGEFLR